MSFIVVRAYGQKFVKNKTNDNEYVIFPSSKTYINSHKPCWRPLAPLHVGARETLLAGKTRQKRKRSRPQRKHFCFLKYLHFGIYIDILCTEKQTFRDTYNVSVITRARVERATRATTFGTFVGGRRFVGNVYAKARNHNESNTIYTLDDSCWSRGQ